jgi:TldD protein
MSEIISPAQLLAQYQLSENHLEELLKTLAQKRIDDGDIYFQSSQSESFVLEEGIIKESACQYAQGVGIRACVEDKTGFAYSAEIEKSALLQAAKAAQSIALNNQDGSVEIGHVANKTIIIPQRYTSLNPLDSMTADQKIALLKSIDKLARQLDPRITQVITQLVGSFETILIMNLNGKIVTDIRPLVRLNVTVVAEENNKRETGSFGGGGRIGYAAFTENGLSEFYVKEAVRQAIQNLSAKPAPAGPMAVVLGSGWPGVLLHEAVGHGLEGDFNRKGTSNFSNSLGQKVASDLVTVVDDGTLQDKRGSLTVDDEGTPTQRTVLIENGILKGYLQDRLNARLMNGKSTGNGRRQSYAHIPMPRMTNTFMLPGRHTHEEIIASVPYGIYAEHFGGGSVDITSGKFVFSTSSAYLIENGKITTPIKGATLIGQGPEVMKKIKMVGNNLALDTGIGSCGKDGQTVPVGVGMPTVLVSEMTVGGTNV